MQFKRPRLSGGGGSVSLLANIYLHEVLDVWFEREVKPRLRGRGFMVRYADDAVLAFEREEDAQRMLAILPKRFGRFGLRLPALETQERSTSWVSRSTGRDPARTTG